MSRYCTAADIRALVPDTFRDAALADSFGGANADPGLLDLVLSSACDEVDALISGRVRLPLPADAIPSKLRTAAALFAAETLCIRRGAVMPEALAAKCKWWRDWLSKIGEGDLRLAASADGEEASVSSASGAAIAARPAVTGSHGLLGCVVFLLAALFPPHARAAADARSWDFPLPAAADVFAAPADLEWSQGESVELVYTAAPSVSGELRWELADGEHVWLAASPAATGSGQWAWSLAPTQSCLPAGRYAGRIASYVQEGTNLLFHRVHALQSVRVHASPWGDIVPSEPVATNVQAWVRTVLAGYATTDALATAHAELADAVSAEAARAGRQESALTNALAGYATTNALAAETARATAAENAIRSSVAAASNAIPSRVSQLANDAGYLTEHQSLSGLATASALTAASNALAAATAAESNRASTAEATLRSSVATASNVLAAAVAAEATRATNREASIEGRFADYATSAAVANSLAGYASTNALATETARATAAENAIRSSVAAASNAIPSLVSQLENDAGYLTEHQSLAGLATSSALTAASNALAAATAAESNRASTAEATLRSSVATASNTLAAAIAAEATRATNREAAIEGRFADYATSAAVANSLAGYATTNALATETARATAAETAIRSSVAAASNAIPVRVSQLENDAGYLTTTPSLSGLVTHAQLTSASNALAAATVAESNRAATAEARLAAATTAASNALASALASETTRATNREAAIESRFSDYATSASVANALGGYATTNALAAETARATAAETALRASVAAASNAIPSLVSQLANDAGYLTGHQSLAGLATSSQLEAATNAIAAEAERAAAAEAVLGEAIETLAATHGEDTAALWDYSRDTAGKLLVVEALVSDTNGTTLAEAFADVAENTAAIADLSRDLDDRTLSLAETQAVHTVQIGRLAKIAGLDGTYFVQPDHNYYFGADFDLSRTWLVDPAATVTSSVQEVFATTCAVAGVSVTGAVVAASVGRSVSAEPAVSWAFEADGGLSPASGTNELDCWISWPADADTNLAVTVSATLDGTERSLSVPVSTSLGGTLLFSGFATGTVQHAWATNMAGLAAAEGRGTALYLAEGAPWSVRDTNCWGAGYDFSCVSVSNHGSINAAGEYHPHFPVTLVASNVGLIASHVLSAAVGIPDGYLSPDNPDYEKNRRTPVNAPIVFTDGAGNCFTSSVPYGFNADGTFFYRYASFGGDGRLVRLDPPLPTNVVPALLLSPRSANRYWGGDVADRNDYAAGTGIAFVAQGLQLYAARAYLNPKHPVLSDSWVRGEDRRHQPRLRLQADVGREVAVRHRRRQRRAGVRAAGGHEPPRAPVGAAHLGRLRAGSRGPLGQVPRSVLRPPRRRRHQRLVLLRRQRLRLLLRHQHPGTMNMLRIQRKEKREERTESRKNSRFANLRQISSRFAKHWQIVRNFSLFTLLFSLAAASAAPATAADASPTILQRRVSVPLATAEEMRDAAGISPGSLVSLDSNPGELFVMTESDGLVPIQNRNYLTEIPERIGHGLDLGRHRLKLGGYTLHGEGGGFFLDAGTSNLLSVASSAAGAYAARMDAVDRTVTTNGGAVSTNLAVQLAFSAPMGTNGMSVGWCTDLVEGVWNDLADWTCETSDGVNWVVTADASALAAAPLVFFRIVVTPYYGFILHGDLLADSLTLGTNTVRDWGSLPFLPLAGGTLGGSLSIGTNAIPAANSLLVVGASNAVNGQNAVAIGTNNAGGAHRALTVGRNNKVIGYDVIALGESCEATANHAEAFGVKAKAKHNEAFAWSGRTEAYESHGTGTWNIDPVDGMEGCYVGETNMGTHVALAVSNGIAAHEERNHRGTYYCRWDPTNISSTATNWIPTNNWPSTDIYLDINFAGLSTTPTNINIGIRKAWTPPEDRHLVIAFLRGAVASGAEPGGIRIGDSQVSGFSGSAFRRIYDLRWLAAHQVWVIDAYSATTANNIYTASGNLSKTALPNDVFLPEFDE